MTSSWARLKQSTRETLRSNAKEQRTELPNDVNSLMLKAEAVEKLYLDMAQKSTAYFPELKLKIKNADDPIKGQPLHQLSDVYDALAGEYHSNPAAQQFFVAASCSMANLARLKADLDKQALEDFIEPKRHLVQTRIKEAEKHYEVLKQRRLELDALKRKLKSERKSDETSAKLKKYEAEVQNAQTKFDDEADTVRELLSPVANEAEMTETQCNQSARLLLTMKDYFYRSFKALEELDKAVDLENMAQFGVSSQVQVRNTHPALHPQQLQYLEEESQPIVSPRRVRSPAPNAPKPVQVIQPAGGGWGKPSAEALSRLGLQATPFVSAQHRQTPPLSPKPEMGHNGTAHRPSAPPIPSSHVATKPKPPPVPSLRKCCALYDFQAEEEGDLAFVKGDIIEVHKQNGEWWEGRNISNNQRGQFPHNYVKLL